MPALRARRVDRVKFSRRHFLHLTAGAVALPAMLRMARAQTYAARPVHLIVGWPPGGAADLLARLIGQPLSQRLGQPLIIENRPGAGSNIATEAVVRAVPNGSTLLHVSSVNAASGRVGSPQHVYGEVFKMMTGVEMLHVPYRGGGPALTDLLAGQVSIMFDTL